MSSPFTVTSFQDVKTSDGPMSIFTALPSNTGQFPVVILLMEIFGINVHIRSVCERLAEKGFFVIAPDYYHRIAPGVELGYSDEDIERGREYKATISIQQIKTDLETTLHWAKQHPQAFMECGVGITGFCFGGHLAYLSAGLFSEIKAIAAFYGAGIPKPLQAEPSQVSALSLTPQITGKVLCFFGAQDSSIPREDVALIVEALEKNHIDSKVVVYPNAGHGFFCDARDSFAEIEATDAWDKTVTLLKQVLAH